MSWRVYLLIGVLLLGGVALYLAIRHFGLIGGVLSPVAAVAAGAGAIAAGIGVKKMPKTQGRPRRINGRGVSPKPEPGKHRARPRR